jgi:DNA-binding response OmpR family regulator
MTSDYTILVVDDHPPTLYAASRMLKSAVFRTIEATNGEDAKRLASSASAALIDVNLPDGNGVELCQYIKEKVGAPVVLMSAVFVDELHRGAGISAGADDYLMSPLDPKRVESVFRRLLIRED